MASEDSWIQSWDRYLTQENSWKFSLRGGFNSVRHQIWQWYRSQKMATLSPSLGRITLCRSSIFSVYRINERRNSLFLWSFGSADWDVFLCVCVFIYRVIKKSLCTSWLQYNRQVHREYFITLYIRIICRYVSVRHHATKITDASLRHVGQPSEIAWSPQQRLAANVTKKEIFPTTR